MKSNTNNVTSNNNPSNLNVIAASNSSIAPFQARVTTNSNPVSVYQKENRSTKTNSFRSNNENSQNNNGNITQLRSEVKMEKEKEDNESNYLS